MNLPALFATVAVLAVIFYAGMRTQRLLWRRRELYAYQRGWDAARAWEQHVRRETWELHGVIDRALDDTDDGDTDEIRALPAGTTEET